MISTDIKVKLAELDIPCIQTNIFLYRAIKQEDVPAVKKIKTEDEVDGDSKENEYREQVKLLFTYRDKLTTLQQSELVDLLTENNQEIPSGKDNVSIIFFSMTKSFPHFVLIDFRSFSRYHGIWCFAPL